MTPNVSWRKGVPLNLSIEQVGQAANIASLALSHSPSRGREPRALAAPRPHRRDPARPTEPRTSRVKYRVKFAPAHCPRSAYCQDYPMSYSTDSAQPQPPAPQYAPPLPPKAPRGLAIAALVTGIVAFLLGLVPIVGIILGLAGVALGVIALVKRQPKGLALTGTILAGIAIIASIATTAGFSSAVDSIEKSASKVETTKETPAAEETEKPSAEEPAEEVEEPEPAVVEEPVVEEPAEPEMTIGQRNASNKAADYLDYSAFSRTGLITQLEFEGFSTEDATFAVDAVGADWNEQAGKKAQDYLDYSSFSRQSLIDQLVFEGFTPDEANFGATAVGY